GPGTCVPATAAATARNAAAKGKPYRKRTCVAPSVPSVAVRLLCIALRAVCAPAATSVAKIHSTAAGSARHVADVDALRTNQPSERALLEAVRGPARDAPDRKR